MCDTCEKLKTRTYKELSIMEKIQIKRAFFGDRKFTDMPIEFEIPSIYLWDNKWLLKRNFRNDFLNRIWY